MPDRKTWLGLCALFLSAVALTQTASWWLPDELTRVDTEGRPLPSVEVRRQLAAREGGLAPGLRFDPRSGKFVMTDADGYVFYDTRDWGRFYLHPETGEAMPEAEFAEWLETHKERVAQR